MNYFFNRRVRQLEKGTRVTSVVKTVDESVLNSIEAHHLLAKYLTEKNYLCLHTPQQMKVVKRQNTHDYYWLREYSYNTYFAVKIGVKSEIIAFKTALTGQAFYAQTENGLIVFEELPISSTIEVFLKDCSWYTKEKTELYVSVFYDADMRKLSLQTLNLRGVDIKNFPHDYWGLCTVSEAGVPQNGCCGSSRTIRASETWDVKPDVIEIYDTISVWTGSKVLKVFTKKDEDFRIDQMLEAWDEFWRFFHH